MTEGYEGSNYNEEAMRTEALALREDGLSYDLIAKQLTERGWTSRRGSPVSGEGVRRLIGSIPAGADGEYQEFLAWRTRQRQAQFFAPPDLAELARTLEEDPKLGPGPYLLDATPKWTVWLEDEHRYEVQEGEHTERVVSAREYLEHLRVGRNRQLAVLKKLMADEWEFTEQPPFRVDISSEAWWDKGVDAIAAELVKARNWDIHRLLDRLQTEDDADGSIRAQLRKVAYGLLRALAQARQTNLALRQKLSKLREGLPPS